MQTLKQIPDISKPLRAMKLVFDIEKAMLWKDTLLKHSINEAVHGNNKLPYSKIISELQSIGKESFDMLANTVGNKNANEIIVFV